jgi:hypothetical protein
MEPLTSRQAALIIAIAAILWAPMMTFFFFFGQDFSPRQLGVIGAINMVVSVPLLILISRRWILKVK